MEKGLMEFALRIQTGGQMISNFSHRVRHTLSGSVNFYPVCFSCAFLSNPTSALLGKTFSVENAEQI